MNYSKKFDQILEDCHIIFSFEVEDLKKQINDLKSQGIMSEDEEVARLGCGLFVPKSLYNSYITKVKEWEDEQKNELLNPEKRLAKIKYELNNYECYYTGEIDEAVEALEGLGITRQEIQEVYSKKSLTYNNVLYGISN